jgi:hypothetical protein
MAGVLLQNEPNQYEVELLSGVTLLATKLEKDALCARKQVKRWRVLQIADSKGLKPGIQLGIEGVKGYQTK